MKLIKLIFLAGAFSAILASCSSPEKTQDNETTESDSKKTTQSEFDPFVKDLLAKMSIEEKVGQMTQVNINMILKDGYGSKDGTIDTAKLSEAVVKYGVGSLLNAVPSAYSVEKWHENLKLIQDAAKNTPNQIPVLFGIDAIHGATFTANSTLFPHNIGMGASRNDELVHRAADITAMEVRASGIRWNFDPTLGVGRNPLWSRFEETFGEDTYIGSRMGAAAIKGYEEDGLKSPTAVASCMKHFIGYSNPRSGKDRTPAYIPEVELRENYLPQFQAATDAGVSTVMINSGEINGIPVHGNEYLLNDVMREELGFNGMAVSDWEDIIRLHTRHRVAATPKEAVKMGVMAGVDMSMVPHDYSFYQLLVELVKEGEVPESRLDEAAGRILQLKYNVGLFDNAYPEEEAVENFAKPEYKKVALDAAEESITLLKNEGDILPISKDAKVLVSGPGAFDITALNSCWSYTWQGDNASVYPDYVLNLAEAFETFNPEENAEKQLAIPAEKLEKSNASNIMKFETAGFEDKASYSPAGIKSKATGADYIVLAVGERSYAESPGVINDLALEQKQLDLINAAVATGKPVILVLIEGRPRLITEVADKVKAIVQAYRPGSQGARAIVNTLYGLNNPSGKLPYTYPRFSGDFKTYDSKFTDQIEELKPGQITEGGYNPLYPFGHGLSYTTFSYSELSLSSDSIKSGEEIEVSVKVSNTGELKGKVAVDMYLQDMFASITPPVKELKGYQKIELDAGESKTVSFKIGKEEMSFVNAQLKRVVEPGSFKVMVGDQTAEFLVN